jgi:hypothetical protein
VTGDGPHLFARYAYPPNALGYCGPADSASLLQQAAAGPAAAGDIAHSARGFAGAWPYLELIAAANRITDPLDRRVVEAYWVGNALLDAVPPGLLAASIEHRFRRRAGRGWERLAEAVPEGARPHHSFHVFAIYPWVGLLREGQVSEPLRVLDRCRVRWGRVEEVRGDLAVVRSRSLTWECGLLGYGPTQLETATLSRGGQGLVDGLRPGEWVSIHWDWVCDRLTDNQRHALARYSRHTLAAVNRCAHPAPAAVLS